MWGGSIKRYFFDNKFSSKEINKLIINYYNSTQILYNLMWMSSSSLAMHYGIWENGTKNLSDAQINENKIIAEKLDLKPSDIVMDAGCGICGTSIWMAKKYNCMTTGLTICQKQIDQAKKLIRKNKIEKLVNVELKDFCSTSYENEYFTKIFGIESICYAPDQKVFAHEVFRLLKPGGRYVRADAFLKSYDMTPHAKIIFSEWCEGWAVPGLITVKDYEEILKEEGFINIKYCIITDKILKSANRMWWMNIPLYIPFLILYKIKLLRKENYMDILASLNQKELFSKGFTVYVIMSADKP